MQKSSNELVPLRGIMVSLVFLISAIIPNDFSSSFRFILSILKSFPGIISCTPVSSSAAAEDQRETDGHRNLPVWGLKTVGAAGIGGLFEEEEPSLMEAKDAFDVFDEKKDGFIDAEELRNALVSLGFVKEAEEDECEKMIKGFDENFDGRIDFNEFVKVLETSFCS
ncbi:hypothetical protein HRI_003670000 [Hibiscus trionum]|uniref:EF-hand domain-containing protein n=1 Tax=Hibiscus trionum TaxID=183268 RepID=A0A9W7MDN5_HIBTR|nr:hypothetical protein HRI_003670000 [Hibiscus trionum]